MKRDYLKIIFGFLLIFALASFLIYSLTFQQAYQQFISFLTLKIVGNHLAGAVIFILIETAAVMLSPLSSVPFLIIVIDIWGKLFALLYSMIGGMLGASLSYLIGKYALVPAMKLFVPQKRIEEFQKIIEKHSSFLLIVLFRLAMPVEIPGYVLGLTKYSFWKYLAATAIAFLPFYILSIYAGEAFIQKNIIILGTFMAVFLILFCISIYIFYQEIKKK
jgi:uncharacterized membrane protein YdjX (TVP38/TMEM64 family)